MTARRYGSPSSARPLRRTHIAYKANPRPPAGAASSLQPPTTAGVFRLDEDEEDMQVSGALGLPDPVRVIGNSLLPNKVSVQGRRLGDSRPTAKRLPAPLPSGVASGFSLWPRNCFTLCSQYRCFSLIDASRVLPAVCQRVRVANSASSILPHGWALLGGSCFRDDGDRPPRARRNGGRAAASGDVPTAATGDTLTLTPLSLLCALAEQLHFCVRELVGAMLCVSV